MKPLYSNFIETSTFRKSVCLKFSRKRKYRKRTILTTLASFGLLMGLSAQNQQIPTDSLEGTKVVLDEVLVQAVRVTKASPVTFTNLKKEEIAPRNLGQDIPILMNFLPGVVTTSDAGAGIGYTGIRVRGSDATRV